MNSAKNRFFFSHCQFDNPDSYRESNWQINQILESFHWFTLISFILFMSSCANIKPPTGGPEDTITPGVKRTIPENNSTNFKGKNIVLEFDEYIDATKLNENIVISPLVDSKYEIITKKKTVTIKFKEPFNENTTYNINLSESIKDVTKGNYIRNLNLAFSTGPFIDSLSIYGNAYDFVKEKPLKDLSILVYSAADTNTIKNSKPRYFSRTDLRGNFSIHNVKEGTYHIYALNDLNKNFRYDNEKEDIAYLKNITVDKNVENIRLGLSRTDTEGPEIVSIKQEFEYYILTLNEGFENYQLKSNNIPVLSHPEEDARTIKVFNNFNSKDSIPLYYEFTDSSGNVSRDTLKILFQEYREKNKKNIFSISVIPGNLTIAKDEEIKIRFNKPVQKIDYNLIKIKKDSNQVNFAPSEFALDSTQQTIHFRNKYTFTDTLVLLFEKGAFIGINGDTSQLTKFKFRNKNEENYGILAGTIICPSPNYIFQLLNNKGKIIDSRKNAINFHYKMLEPGEYQPKLIIDVNNNGRWDATNLDLDLPPEPIYYYREKINLRANWEMLDLKFEVK